MSLSVSRPVSVIAIISAYNEADIIAQVVEDLISQEVSVYLLDDGSSDDTIAQVEPFLGRGVVAIERFSMPGPPPHEFALEPILRRKSQLAQELEADWFVHHDADEFRETPWPGVTLRAGIQFVHDAGYNAIDFTCLEFDGNVDSVEPTGDVKSAFRQYARAAAFNHAQIRCWRRGDQMVDLSSSGGHDATFPNRQVFPIRFLLRHYPIRGQSHLRRKVMSERNYAESERAKGWHIQYAGWTEDGGAPSRPVTSPYRPEQVRLEQMLRHRMVEDLESKIARLSSEVGELNDTLSAVRSRCEDLQLIVDHRGQLLDTICQSRSWRWSSPARTIGGWFRSRR